MRRCMLGNGYYARPVEMDGHFDSICEFRTFFITMLEFLAPICKKGRQDAVATGQLGRQKIFDEVCERLDAGAS